MSDDELDAWQVPGPPGDFADRVLAARQAEVAKAASPRQPRRTFRAGLAAGVLLVAALAVLLLLITPASSAGSLSAGERSSVALGRRAVAVAEAGAELHWRVAGNGAARVAQSQGDVFYRVEPGGLFVVSTPAGEVTVTGTCFRVEVLSMKPSKQALVGAAVGAAVTAAVLVTVYEGRVILANERGKTEVKAGERASASTGVGPGPAVASAEPRPRIAVKAEPPAPPADNATRAELLARDQAQRNELAALRQRVAELEQGGGEAGGPGGPGRHRPGKGDGPFFSPSHEELLEMAKNCEVRFDNPPLGNDPVRWGPKMGERFGLSADELAKINEALADLNGKTMAQLRALYIEVTGNTAASEDLTSEAMLREIEEKSGRGEVAEAAKQLSHERAGLVPPPADLKQRPPVERALRLMSAIGDATEQGVAGVVGPERAHDIRAKEDGWGSRTRMAGCRDGDDEEQQGRPPAKP